MKDFSVQIYRRLLVALLQADYAFYTFEDWCDQKAKGKFVILRHDVDLKARNSLVTAQIEAELGIRSTYYFRVVPQSNQPEIINAIAKLGHEIGYHYEDMSLFNGNIEKSIEHFKSQLTHFRQFYPVRTICMHGSPTSRWDNKDLWKDYDYRDYGIVGEPYFDFLTPQRLVSTVEGEEMCYLTDTARMWDGYKYNVRDKAMGSGEIEEGIKTQNQLIHSTFDFIHWLETKPSVDVMMITTHPQRWTDNWINWTTEFVFQSMKNVVKRIIVRQKNHTKTS